MDNSSILLGAAVPGLFFLFGLLIGSTPQRSPMKITLGVAAIGYIVLIGLYGHAYTCTLL